MRSRDLIERLVHKAPRGLASRIRIFLYRLMGLRAGKRNRLERVRLRRVTRIQIGDFNTLTEGCWLWPDESEPEGIRIAIGHGNYFNRDCIIDACGRVEIGDQNMFGPGVFITDSNHGHSVGIAPEKLPMQRGVVRIGSRCWIGARAIILRNVELGDDCVVGAGAVVTKSFHSGSVVAGVPARRLDSTA